MTLKFLTTMRFHVRKTPDGLYHVQNSIAGHLGQHHVHTEQSFHDWLKESDEVTLLDDGPCDCGLGAGDVRDHNGNVSHKPEFASE